MNYTIKDLISKKIIVSCNYAQAKTLALLLKEENVDVSTIDSLMPTVDKYTFLISVEDGKVVGHTGDEAVLNEELYAIIGFNQLDIFANECMVDKEFELNEIVHVVLNRKAQEPFNPFISDEHVTAYISAIDYGNKMCEVVYLHEKHAAIWVRFEDIYHIDHIYDEDEEFSIYEEDDENV